MRNLKKLLAVLVVVAMIATSMITAFADTTTTAAPISAAAKACADIGMLTGSGNGVTAEYTATTVTRMQVARLLLRLKGLEADALATTATANFTDTAATNADGVKIMAYLKAHPELGFGGYVDGKFGPADLMNAQQYYKVLLTALGFTQKDASGNGDFAYADTFTFAAQHGLTALTAANNAKFTIDNLAVATVETLKATMADGKTTVAQALIAAGKLDATKAAAAGLVTAPATTALDVSSVAAVNYNTVKLTLGTTCTAADVAAAVITVKDSAGTAVAVTNKVLYADKDVRVTTADTAANTKYTLTYNGVSYDYIGMDKDTVAPKVTAVAVAQGYMTVDVTFDKILDKASAEAATNYTIDGGLTVTSAALQAGDMVVRLTTAAQTAGKLYTITVAGVKSVDLANVDSTANTAKFGGVAKLGASTVTTTAITVSNTKVMVLFSDSVDDTSAAVAANYAIDGGLTVTNAAVVKSDDATYPQYAEKAVYLTTAAQTAGKLYTITVTNVKNIDGVSIDTANNTAKFGGVGADTTAPTVTTTAIPVSNTSVTVSFNQLLDATTSQVAANYTIDGGLTVSKAVLQSDNKSVKLTTSAQTGGKLYTITVAGVKNTNNVVVDSANNTAKFGGVALDTVGPSVLSAYARVLADGAHVYVTFDKPVDATSAQVAANYSFNNGLGYAKTATLVTGSTTQVDLKTADQSFNTLYTLTVSLVKSSDGVVLVAANNTTTFAGAGSDVAPKISFAQAISTRALKITFNTNLTAAAANTNTNYSIVTPAGATINPTAAVYNDTDKTVTCYFNTTSFTTAPFAQGSLYTLTVNSAVVNARGVSAVAADYTTPFAGVNTAPDFKVDYIMAVDNKTFDVYFTDNIANTAGAPTGFTAANVFVSGGTQNAAGADANFRGTGTNLGADTINVLSSNNKVLRVTLAAGTGNSLVAGQVYTIWFGTNMPSSVGGLSVAIASGVSATSQFAGSTVAQAAPAISYMIARDSRSFTLVFTSPVANLDGNTTSTLSTTSPAPDPFTGAGIAVQSIVLDTANNSDGSQYIVYLNQDTVAGHVYTLTIPTAVGVANSITQTANITGTVAASTTAHAAPAISTVSVDPTRYIVTVTLNQKVATVAGVTPDNELTTTNLNALFTFDSTALFEDGTAVTGTGAYTTTTVKEFNADGKTITFTLAKRLMGTTSPKVVLATNNVIDLMTVASKAAPVAADYTQFSVPVDNLAPTASTYVATGATLITITLNEKLDATKFATLGTHGFTTSNGTLTSATLAADGYHILLNGTGWTGGTTTVSYATSGGIVDLNSNALAAITTHATT